MSALIPSLTSEVNPPMQGIQLVLCSSTAKKRRASAELRLAPCVTWPWAGSALWKRSGQERQHASTPRQRVSNMIT